MGYTFQAWGFITVGIFSSVLFATALTGIISLPCYFWGGPNRKKALGEILRGGFLAAALGILAWVVGYLMGASRESAAGDVVPAVLGALGAAGSLVGVRYGRMVLTGMLIVSFSFSLFIGSAVGSKIRQANADMDRQLPPLDVLEDSEADKELFIKRSREKLGLPWPPAKWPSTGD